MGGGGAGGFHFKFNRKDAERTFRTFFKGKDPFDTLEEMFRNHHMQEDGGDDNTEINISAPPPSPPPAPSGTMFTSSLSTIIIPFKYRCWVSLESLIIR